MGPPRPVRLLASALAVAVLCAACQIPSLEEEQENAPPLAQTSVLYADNGKAITRLHAEQDRVVVTLDTIPKVVQDAVVAIEDERFWQHRGVDVKAILRAAYVNAQTGGIAEGGSTITQQYIKQTLVGSEQTLERKLREATLAWQLEERMSKRQILEAYLNTVYFGKGAYGIQAAARRFFAVPASDLTLAQAALLAGVIRNPDRYDPLERPEDALARREVVLDKMLELGMITRQAYAEATEEELKLKFRERAQAYPAPYFVDYLKRRLLRASFMGETPAERYRMVFEGGLRIHSTVDLKMQDAAERAIKNHLPYESDPYVSLVAIDPRTGFIKAMVGGRNFFAPKKVDRWAKVNIATGEGGTGRQTGSAFKTFTLAAAVERGISLRSVFAGPSRVPINDPRCRTGGRPWTPANYSDSGFGTMDLVSATARSVNTIFAQLVMKVGPERVVDVAHRLGIKSHLDPVCSITLGVEEVSTLEMTSAYATLAAGGIRRDPMPVRVIETADGEVFFKPKTKGKRVMKANDVWQVVYALQRVVSGGTGTAANIPGVPIFGKTGTTDDHSDAWFCGATTVLAACVQVGYPQGRLSMRGVHGINVTGGSFPARIWHDFMVQALPKKRIAGFPTPTFTGRLTTGSVAIPPSPSPTPPPPKSKPKPKPNPDPDPEPEPTPSPTPEEPTPGGSGGSGGGGPPGGGGGPGGGG